MFVCNVCGKEYKYKTGLWRHKKFECGQEPKYQCPQCPYKTKHNSSLKTHMKVSLVGRRQNRIMLVCSYVMFGQFRFSESFTSWEASEPNHAGLFVCDVCDRRYKYKSGLYQHKKYECGKEPRYQCPQCPHRTKQKSSLKTHMAVKHSD
ncbi:zinc finger protein 425-like [Diaphorina citri]|uniref:Zinc finger protein 425-like n=1 Tax=Diaphorina citri TaxID=121845 RepID=A0A1S4EKJ9_DIACI|nr:zinc finger protein 425-like [Diaphorina citri]